jgi:hypothetical protein
VVISADRLECNSDLRGINVITLFGPQETIAGLVEVVFKETTEWTTGIRIDLGESAERNRNSMIIAIPRKISRSSEEREEVNLSTGCTKVL